MSFYRLYQRRLAPCRSKQPGAAFRMVKIDMNGVTRVAHFTAPAFTTPFAYSRRQAMKQHHGNFILSADIALFFAHIMQERQADEKTLLHIRPAYGKLPGAANYAQAMILIR